MLLVAAPQLAHPAQLGVARSGAGCGGWAGRCRWCNSAQTMIKTQSHAAGGWLKWPCAGIQQLVHAEATGLGSGTWRRRKGLWTQDLQLAPTLEGFDQLTANEIAAWYRCKRWRPSPQSARSRVKQGGDHRKALSDG